MHVFRRILSTRQNVIIPRLQLSPYSSIPPSSFTTFHANQAIGTSPLTLPSNVTLSSLRSFRCKTTTPEPTSSSSSPSSDTEMTDLPDLEGKEIRFPVSWGHIAAKEWGDPRGHPFLLIHGWLDNLGSFEPLIPHLLRVHNLHIVAIDEPGCGLSSHKPPGSDYNRWAHLREIRRIIDYLNWKEVNLIGHSLGAGYSLVMAAAFPDLVKRVVSIDIPKPLTMLNDLNWMVRLPRAVAKHIEYDELFMKDPTLESTAPVYTEEQALKKMMEAHGNSLTEQSARILMKRGVKKHPSKDGLIFTRDIRQKLPTLDPAPTEETMIKFINRMKCDILVIRAKQGAYQLPPSLRQKYYSIYERNCRLFQDAEIDGTHHLHMNNPEQTARAINEFLRESFRLTSGFTYVKSPL